MNKTVVGFASVMLVSLAFGATKPIAQWSFDDATNIGAGSYGTAALEDHSADGKSPTSVEGHVGNAYHAADGSMMLGLSTDVPTGNSPFTWSGWLRPSSSTKATAYLVICSPITGGKPGSWSGASWGGWHLRFESATELYVGFNSWGKAQGGTSDREFGVTVANTIYKDGSWHHFVVSRDAQNLVKIYLDGALKGSKTISTSIAANSRVRLGTHAVGSNNFIGDYDEVMAFSQCLTAEEIAAIYQTRKPIPETRLVDEATTHWSFDESVTEGGNRLFKDTGVAKLQCDFLNVTNSAGEFVECVTGEDINGGAAYVRAKGSCLKLLDGSRAGSKLVQYGWPTFTISIRLKNVSYAGTGRFVPLCFGDGKRKETCLRLSYERTADADPQYLKVLAGEDGTAHALDDTSVVADAKAPWTTITLVNNQVAAGAGVMKVYRDGVFVKEISTAGTQQGSNKTVFNFDLSFIGIGSNNLSTFSGFMVDDFCVFRKRVLNEAEIKRLVLEQAGLTGAPLADAAVSVARDATLKVGAGEYAIASLAGAGVVNLDPHATLAVGDWSGFTGAFSGSGAVRVSKLMPDRTFALAVIDPTGVVAFDAEPKSGNYVVAKAGAFELPSDYSGWKVLVGGVEMPSEKYRFKAVGDTFVCKIKGGMAVIVR